MNRYKWPTYTNFGQMYEQIAIEMMEAKAAKCLGIAEWQDEKGAECDEKNAFGCKVIHRVTHPEKCLVMNEVGANIGQRGNGHVVGRLVLCAQGDVPQKKVFNGDRHFTTIPITLLTGEPLICIVIFSGKIRKSIVETGIDCFVETTGDPRDADYFEKNSNGCGKRSPFGPLCIYKSKKIPTLC